MLFELGVSHLVVLHVGSQTPGVCLVMNIKTLPYGTILAYPIAEGQTPDGRVLENNGVVPDIEVVLDRADLLQGRDTQLEAALNYIE
jgi:C-terminal processing protease CtpA/Prc